jgi:cyclophilin family peptidyl-prolyl cis-trans isomerase/HEAT repeat protein
VGAPLGALLALTATAAAVPRSPALLPPKVQRIWAELLRMEDGRLPAAGVYPYLRHVDRRVRALAARTLGRLAEPKARVHLEPRLRDDADGEVRAEAALALGLIGAREAVPELTRALKDVDAAPSAARALGFLQAEEAVGDLVALAKNPGRDTGLRKAAYLALAAMPDKDGVSKALPARPPKDGIVARAAAYLIRRIMAKSPFVPAPAWVESVDPVVRAELLRGFAKAEGGASLEGAAAALVPQGTNPLKGLGRAFKLALVDFLAAVESPPQQGRAANLWSALTLDGDPHVLLAVLRAVPGVVEDPGKHKVRAKLAPIVPRLLERDGFPAALRAACVKALKALAPSVFKKRLPGLMADDDPQVRAALATAYLGDEDAKDELDRIGGRLWDDPDRRVQLAATEALATRKGSWSTRLLRGRLEASEPPLVAAAATELVERLPDDEDLATDIMKALRRVPLPHHEERSVLVGLLAKLESRAYLERLTQDPDVLVREQASRHLGKPLPERRATGLPPESFYQENLTRYSPRPRVKLTTSKGVIEVVLDLAEAPLNVWNFLALVTTGYYDGLTYHRVVPGFVSQGGDPRRDGYGGPGYMVRCEVGLAPYERGTVGVALAGRDTGGSQFFVTYGPAHHLEGGYTVLGKVASGMDVLDRMLPGDGILKATLVDEEGGKGDDDAAASEGGGEDIASKVRRRLGRTP